MSEYTAVDVTSATIQRVEKYQATDRLRGIRFYAGEITAFVRAKVEDDLEEVVNNDDGTVSTHRLGCVYSLNPYNLQVLKSKKVLQRDDTQEWTEPDVAYQAGATAAKLSIFSAVQARTLYKSYVCAEGPLKSSTAEGFDFVPMLLPLFKVRGFEQAWESYTEDPDEGCNLMPTTIPQSFYSTSGLAADAAIPHRTASDVLFHVVMICTTAAKNLVTDNQLSANARARSNGLSYTIGSRGLTPERAVSLVHEESFRSLSRSLTFFPKMRAMIYSHIIVNADETPMLGYLRPLLADNQMTVYKMITLFCFSPLKCKAHLISEVASEMLAFLQRHLEVIKRYGEKHWEYSKLLNPTETATSTVAYPALVSVAFYHSLGRVKSESLRNLRVKAFMHRRLIKAVCTPIRDEFLTVQQEKFTDIYDQIPESFKDMIGLKIDEIKTAGIDHVCGDVDEDMAKEISSALDYMQTLKWTAP